MTHLDDSKTDETGGGPAHALVIDDHPLFCDALELTLKSIPGMATVLKADTLETALGLVDTHGAPALTVLDLNLPDVTGLDGLIRLKKALGAAPVIVVSSLADNEVIASVLQAGAAGFVPKHSSRAVIQTAIDTIRAGGAYVPPSYVEPPMGGTRADAVQRLSSLTNQQARILELICEGRLNKQIAFELSIAETTVKAHVTAIMRKLGVQSRTQAVLVAQEAKFSSMLQSSAP